MLDKAIDSVDGKSIRVAIADLGGETDKLSTSTTRASSSIDQFSGRLAVLAKVAATLGPSLAPIGAVGIAGVAGLASQLGFAAVGMGSLIVAAQGMGDALKAVNAAALEPTAENLQKARDAMALLGPEAQQFVTRFQELRPVLADIRDAAAAGWFPGLTKSLDDVERLAPAIERLFLAFGDTGGDLFADMTEELNSQEWREFISFLTIEGPPALEALSRSVGNVARGLAELWMAFEPLNQGFSDWLLSSSRDFAEWADGLSRTEGFQEFIAYVQENGPKVADAFVAIADAAIQIIEAAAPLGGPVLVAVTHLAEAIASIANSPLGTPIMAGVTALSALSIAANIATGSVTRLNAAMGKTPTGGGLGSKLSLVGKGGATAVIAGVIAGLDNVGKQFEKLEAGAQSFEETFARAFIPGIREMSVLEGLWDEFGDDISDFGRRLMEGGGTSFLSDQTYVIAKYAAEVRHVGSVSEYTAAEIRGLTSAMEQQKQAALGAFDAETRYREALKAAGAQAKKNEAGIRGNSEAALRNREALGQLAAAWNNQSAKVRNNVERFKEARRQFIETAEAMGVPKKRAEELANAIMEIPRQWVTRTSLEGADKVRGAIQQLRNDLANPIFQEVIVRYRGRNYTSQPTPPGGGNPLTDPVNRPIVTERGVTSKMDLVGGTMSTVPFSNRSSSPAMGVSETAVTLSALNGQLDAAVERYRRANRQLRMMERALERQEKAIDKQREVVEDAARAIQDTLAQMASFRQDISGRLTSGLFANGSDFASVIGTLQGNGAAGESWSQSLTALLGMGLDGPALQALLEQSDAAQLAGVAGWSSEQIAQFEDLFNRSSAETDFAGELSAQAVYSEQLSVQRQQWAEEKVELQAMNAVIREMRDAYRAQEKYVQYLERIKERVENREQKNAENLKKIADRKGPDFGDAARRRS